MDTMISVWTVVEHVRVASGAAELAIFTAILYWFFTSSRVADMLEVVGERVGGWCGRDSTSLRQAVRARRRPLNDVYSKIDAELASRTSSLYRVKEGLVVPAPQPPSRPPAGLACARCAPLSRESWQDPKSSDSGSVINILDIGRQNFANGGVVSRYLCDLAQCFNLVKYDYKDVVPSVIKDERFQQAIEQTTQEELRKANGEKQAGGSKDQGSSHYGESNDQSSSRYAETRKLVEARAMKVLMDISSAMSNNVLRLVAWLCHKAIRRIARGGCSTRIACVERLRRAKAAGLPLVFVPLHRSHFDYILVTFTLYLTGLRPPLVAAGDNMRIPFFGAYILNSLGANNNLEFFIEGGRTRTGKPQPPKAGILSVIMDAYLDGTIDDALLVPVTLNYEKLVDGNFVREQFGMPKQMETFWSALRGIWSTLNTNHGGIRVDFNQPISLKELVTSFQKYNYLKAPIERCLTPPNNNLAVNLDKQILYNHSHCSLYGDEVSTDHKIMVEAIGRHLVYDAAQSTALMSTNVVSYVLLTEQRAGCTLKQLQSSVEARGEALRRAGRDLGYTGESGALVKHAMEMLGRGLVRRDSRLVRAQPSISASLELSYYANALVAHYAAPAILATALESIVCQQGNEETVRHSDLIEASLQLCEVLSQEFIICPPCQRIEERMLEAVNSLIAEDVISEVQVNDYLEEQRWSRRFAKTLDDDDEERQDPCRLIKYRISKSPEAIAERRRLLLSIRPVLEAYEVTCKCVTSGTQKAVVNAALDSLTVQYMRKRMPYGEAVSTDAIRNCLKLLRQWGVIEMYSEGRERRVQVLAPYDDRCSLDAVCNNVYKFNMCTPILSDAE